MEGRLRSCEGKRVPPLWKGFKLPIGYPAVDHIDDE
jgi:hypothetical protein